MTTYYLSNGPDINAGNTGGNVIVATDGELNSDDQIDAGSGGDNTLELSGAGTFDLSAPQTLTYITYVQGDTGNVEQTITLRPDDGAGMIVNLGGGDDTVFGADNDDTINGGSGSSTITIGGAGETFNGGAGSSTINIDASLVGAGGATVNATAGGAAFNSMTLTGGDNTATTIGSNIQGIQYLNVADSNVTLDTGSIDNSSSLAPIVFLNGSGDAVTLQTTGETATDYGGSQQITMAAEDQTLNLPYAGMGEGNDTLSGFDQSDTIDLSNSNFDTSSDDVSVTYDSTDDQLVVTSDDSNGPVATETIDLVGNYLGNFSIGTDPSNDAEVLFSGYNYTAPANPASTQPVYYIGLPDNTDSGLVTSDGTSGGTQIVEPGQDTLQQQGFTGGAVGFADAVVGGKIYLVQSFSFSSSETAVWVSDGTANGTMPLVDLGAQNQTLEPGGPTGSPFGAAGTDAIFLTDERVADAVNASANTFNQTFDVTLWSTDGTNSGTTAIDTFTSETGEAPVVGEYLGSSSSDAYFQVSVGSNDVQLWATDGTSSGTQAVFDSGTSEITDFVPNASGGFFSLGGTLYEVSGTTATAQSENAGTVEQVLGTFQNQAVYASYNSDDVSQSLLNVGTTELGTTSTSSYLLAYDAAIQVGSNLVIDDNGTLYGSDGSAGSLYQLTPSGDYVAADTLASPGNSALIGNTLYFAMTIPGTSGGSYVALYETDGTVAGTTLVDDFEQEVSGISQLTNADGTLYFSGGTPGGTFLFRSDGTAAGTYPVGTGSLDEDPEGIVSGVTPDSPEPMPQTYDLSSSDANFVVGTSYDDTFVAPSGSLKTGDSIDGHGGYDRLVLSGNGTFDLSAPTVLTGISEVDGQTGGVSGSTQTIDLRVDTDMIDRIGSSNSQPYVVVGADNSDTIVGTGGENFSSEPTTQISIGSANETIEVSNAVLTADASEAGALIRDPFSLTIGGGGTVSLNQNDYFTSTFDYGQNGGVSAINLSAATDLSVVGGSFVLPQYTSVVEEVGGNTISLGNNGTFFIFGAAGGDTVDIGGSSAKYELIGTGAELSGDAINDFAFSLPQVDTIDITDFVAANPTYTYSGTTLTVTDGSQSVSFDIPGGSSTAFSVVQTGSGTEVAAANPCFCRGTMIQTPAGEVPVETLSVGDLVMTLSGEVKPIIWIGFGRTLVTPRNRCDVAPVIVRRNALAENVPHRDLHVTRRHAILVEDVLVPVEHLINGVSVMWDNAACVVEYYHIELDDHDVLLADGAPAESFRDDDSRHLFQNERCRPPRSGWAPACRPLVTQGPWLEHAWRAVAGRVGKLPEDRLTGDPGLHLVAEGHRVDPSFAAGEIVRFSLDRPPTGEIEIVSRTCIPAAQGLNGDLRRLGVGVTGLTIFYEGGRRMVALSADQLAAGFHAFEGHVRWTKGRGVLPASLFADISGPVDIELRLAGSLPYPRDMEGSFGECRSPGAVSSQCSSALRAVPSCAAGD